MVDDAPLTWPAVNALLKAKPRGAGYQLAQRLGMNSSYFYRKLKSGGDLSERQAQVTRAFLREDATPAAALPAETERNTVPVFGYAAGGGDDLIALADGDVIDHMKLPYGLELGPGEWFVVKPIGSSMEPRIMAGEALLIRRRAPASYGKDVLVELADGTALVKLYRGQRDGQVFLEQLNPPRTFPVEATKVRAIHGAVIKLP